MQTDNVLVDRYNPEMKELVTQVYSIPIKKDDTVLQALLYIYENCDPTLAFRYGCRGAKCGECALDVDGRPSLACLRKAHDGMRVSPLKHLPALRDLIVDRRVMDRMIASARLYVSPQVAQPLGSVPIPAAYERLIGCLECYACISSCPNFDWRNSNFGGPYVFVRLAQLHLDPRDKDDRQAQAISLGIMRCSDCSQCRCVKGIAIRRDAIGTLLGEKNAREHTLKRAED